MDEPRRLTVKAWADANGYSRAIKAMTGEDCDKLKEALMEQRKAVLAMDEWQERKDAADAVIAAFSGTLDRINAASKASPIEAKAS